MICVTGVLDGVDEIGGNHGGWVVHDKAAVRCWSTNEIPHTWNSVRWPVPGHVVAAVWIPLGMYTESRT